MEINDQRSVEEVLQAWVNLSYKHFNGKEKIKDNGEERRQIVDRLKIKGIDSIVIEGMDNESYRLTYNEHHKKRTKKVMIQK
ncbi:hypothetical protein Amet_1011 [Alkaliphilus metalliredigens QYMF]|uniref:Uncharacterized protein n=1 Tax=Alkaliphilus metalliredigens (strain QYMF) TaxID=293826 RepID=A6TM10_ALKMQ|nr:hypothetical protein [Alkaliphilus metalliredigens]ABR47228.1 hypothetical protein Amet_1011 [Alkaliphilus metalliredigens QYMF]